MNLFGFRFQAKREPRYLSYKHYEELNVLIQNLRDGLTGLDKRLEVLRVKVYRDEKKAEVSEVIEGDGKRQARMPVAPGTVLTQEQVNAIFLGRG
jgi:hypothetical protein